jgi:protoporphyrinogen oxidase
VLPPERGDAAPVVVIGGGPAGLTAGLELVRAGVRPIVLEKGADVGGLARTVEYRGFRFDMGGHRFFTKVPEVQTTWRVLLGPDFLRRPRLSRIYYRGRFFHYPLRPLNALRGLGAWQGIRVGLSYLKWQVWPHRREDTFEEWVTNRFGRRLFLTFFKTYTEKVWGVSCSELRAEWAAQRIKDLSLRTALVGMFVRPRRTITTLIEEFEYPRLGPGTMWQAAQARVEAAGGTVLLESEVCAIHREGSVVTGVEIARHGQRALVAGRAFVSSMPLTELVARLEPPAPPPVLAAARRLAYRDFLTVCLILRRRDVFPDNWIYVHDPDVRVGRIQNYKNWSPAMVPDLERTSLGLEYFCTEEDDLWRTPNEELIALAAREIARIGIAREDEVEDGCVVRVPKAYPVYDATYSEHLAVVRRFVDGLDNLQTIGRNGLHRYNNQDHAMVTGMLAVRNLLHGERHDLWSVNTDQDYHEEVQNPGMMDAIGDTLGTAFARLDRVAFGAAVGAGLGVALCVVTVTLAAAGTTPLGEFLMLLSQYFPGYRVSAWGAVLGLVYGFGAGFTLGWIAAALRNTLLFVSLRRGLRRTRGPRLRRLLDYI